MSGRPQIIVVPGLPSTQEIKVKPWPRWVQIGIFILEILFVLFLLVWWLSSKSIRKDTSLWVLFFYCFPAEFIIATVPHEPVLFYFGQFYSPLTVALISIAGTALTEILNYTAFRYIANLKILKKMVNSGSVRKIIRLFQKAPFLAIWIAAFTPIPFYPIRFLVVLAKYPLVKYLLAIVASRTPRFFILAATGGALKTPDYFIIVIIVAAVVVTNLPLLGSIWKNRRRRQKG